MCSAFFLISQKVGNRSLLPLMKIMSKNVMSGLATTTLLLLLSFAAPTTRAALPDSLVLSNGVLDVTLNGIAPPGGRYPCITQLAVDGVVIVPPIAVGALFQMDVRSQAGDNYNPTQSGACGGAASQLSAWEPWAFVGANKANGILMGVVPRTFESSTGACTNGEATPFYFNWGVQLGDDVSFPKEIMLVEMTFARTAASAPAVDSLGVEVPTVYYDCNFAQFAYYLPQDDPSHWVPMNHPSTNSNDVSQWPVGDYFMLNGFGNMRCNGNATADPTTVLCAATYTSGFATTCGGLNNGAGGCPANMVPSTYYLLDDMNTYGRLAIFAVGNLPTIVTAIAQTVPTLSGGWGNLP